MLENDNFIQKKLYGFDKYFIDFSELIKNKKLPKVLMLSGKKGQGKFTFIHHLLAFFFDKNNYITNSHEIKNNNKIFYDLKKNVNSDIVYYSCYNNLKIDQIRELRIDLQKSSMISNNRFIIFDDVEHLNSNCINALLKIIEEPSETNSFILINNQKKIMLDTMRSRTIDIKIFMNKEKRKEIIQNLLLDMNIDFKLELNDYSLMPGEFLKFNFILNEEIINLDDDLVVNLQKLLKLHKNKKDDIYFNLSIYLINNYYYKKSNNISLIDECVNKRSLITKKLYDYNRLNLNHSTFITELERYI